MSEQELDGTKKKGVVKYWVIDGHGRLALLRKLRDEEGYQVPEIPVVEIEAVSYQDAKRKVLAASSSFHRVSKDGLYEFMTEAGLTMEDLAAYDLAEIDLPAFGAEYFDVDPDIQPPETHSISSRRSSRIARVFRLSSFVFMGPLLLLCQ